MDSINAPVELREARGEGSPGRLVGTILRYGSPGEKGRETFAPGALSWPDRGIRIDVDHLSSPVKGRIAPPVALAVPFHSDDGSEVRIDVDLAPTTQARDLAELMRLGLYRSMSVEFRSARSRWSGGKRTIVQAQLVAAALTDNPSYPDTAAALRTDGRRRIWH